MVPIPVLLKERRLGDYAAVVPPEVLAALRLRAQSLAGLRVLHLSASPFATAVSETLAALVPLQRDLGILADWQLLGGDVPRIWSTIYEGLKGAKVRWGWKERAAWYHSMQRQAAWISAGYDVIVVHDPQAVPIAQVLSPSASHQRWVWHCHMDVRRAHPPVWADLRRALPAYDAALFPSPDLAPPDALVPHRGYARPAIDPCSLRNLPLPPAVVDAVIQRVGLDPARPIVGQFGPMDQRYEPLAALGSYWLARREVPGLQIVLADATPPFAERYRFGVDQVVEAAQGDPDIHVLTPESDLGATEVNALQRALTVVLQLAVPAGFGWSVADCQWKGKPAVVGCSGQLADQVAGGEAGFVVQGAPDAADAVVRLLKDPVLALEVGERSRTRVLRRHLVTGLADDYLELFRHIVARVGVAGGA